MNLTLEQLTKIFPKATAANRQKYLPYINKYADRFGVNTSDRMAIFLAQVGHETGSFLYSEEIASGAAYEGRASLGNTQVGDGKKFKGRGLIQVTGRRNYTLFNKWLHDNNFLDKNTSILDTPEIVAKDPELAVLSAFWYWDLNKLNLLADKPK